MSFPHFYRARAEASANHDVVVTSGGLPPLTTAPPPEFGGPGNRWSPETLTVAAVADCLSLTFKAVAHSLSFGYTKFSCDVQGQLDRHDRVTSFTNFRVNVHLALPPGSSVAEARRLIDMPRHHCLITNSLKASVHFDTVISIDRRGGMPGEAVATFDGCAAAASS
jgi:organic hydroperoxide reductase OsmC/OhrA